MHENYSPYIYRYCEDKTQFPKRAIIHKFQVVECPWCTVATNIQCWKIACSVGILLPQVTESSRQMKSQLQLMGVLLEQKQVIALELAYFEEQFQEQIDQGGQAALELEAVRMLQYFEVQTFQLGCYPGL